MDLEVGQRATRELAVDAAAVRAYAELERRICAVRRTQGFGPHRIQWALGVARSTVYAVLKRHGLHRLDRLHRVTREPVRYEHAVAGDLLHLDVKKLGRIPEGGGKRIAPGFAETRSGPRPGRSLGLEYLQLTGDYNPLHFDGAFARGTRFGRLIAQGGLATGLLHALVAMDLPGPGSVFVRQRWTLPALPGPGSVFVRQRWTFPAPVYIDDTIRASATVTKVNARRAMADLACEVTNQDGVTVLRGDATVLRVTPEGS